MSAVINGFEADMKRFFVKIVCIIWMFRRADFYRDMADAFRRKVSLRDFLAREVENSKLIDDSVNLVVMRLLAAKHAEGRGDKLTELLAGVAPRADLMLLAAVDDSKNRASDLERAAKCVEFQIGSMRTLLANMIVPMFAVPIVGTICVITSEIVVDIGDEVPAEVWQGFNGFVRTLAAAINTYWTHMSAVLVALIAAVIYLLPRWVGAYRVKADDLPVVCLYRDYNAVVVMSSLAMMIGAGKSLRQALDDLRATGSVWLRWHLRRVVNSLDENPTDYLMAFSRGLMPKRVRGRLASLLDSSESFDVALIQLGGKEVDRLSRRVESSAVAAKWILTCSLTALAVVLSLGQMTIATALSQAMSPSSAINRSR